MVKSLLVGLGLSVLACLHANSFAQTPTIGNNAYAISADGQEVTDTSTGLVWRRCAEGARWDGSNCSGIADTYNYNDALGRASRAIGLAAANPNANAGPADIRSTPAASSHAWRLPTVYELSSITDRNRSNPTIDGAAFPGTPASWHWTSTFDTTNPSYIWIISFYNGYASNIGPYNKGYVRLVRGATQSVSQAK